MSPAGFWAAIAAQGLRAERPPSWVAEKLKARVSVGFPLVPGSPAYEPPRQDDRSEPEEGQ